MPSTLAGVCLAATAALFWQAGYLPQTAAECVFRAAASWFAHGEPAEALPAPAPPAPPVVIVRRPLVGLPAHRQLVHDLSAREGWAPELWAALILLAVLFMGFTCGFCCRRCLELPELVVRNGAGSARANARGVDRRAIRG